MWIRTMTVVAGMVAGAATLTFCSEEKPSSLMSIEGQGEGTPRAAELTEEAKASLLDRAKKVKEKLTKGVVAKFNEAGARLESLQQGTSQKIVEVIGSADKKIGEIKSGANGMFVTMQDSTTKVFKDTKGFFISDKGVDAIRVGGVAFIIGAYVGGGYLYLQAKDKGSDELRDLTVEEENALLGISN